MKSRGISGFGIIVLIIILLIVGYVGYQIGGVHFRYGAVRGKVENAAKIAPSLTDYEVINQIVTGVKDDTNIELDRDSISIDRSIPDSLRIYVAYDDSSDIFGFYTYSCHFQIDEIVSTKMQY